MESYGNAMATQQRAALYADVAQGQATIGATAATETIVQRVASASEVLLSNAEGIEKRLHEMRARLIGAVPQPATSPQPAQPTQFSGIVGTIDGRLTQAYHAMQRTHELISQLEKIA